MQVVGTKALEPFIQTVANRSSRPEVSEWASRVLRRHVKRSPDLLNPVKSLKGLQSALKADDLSDEVQTRVLLGYNSGEDIFVPASSAVKAFFARAVDTMDWLESLPEDDRRIRRIDRMAWAEAEQQSANWHICLQKARSDSKGMMDGVVKLMELGGGSFAGELTTKGALVAEGKAMGHCVGGYWDRVSKGSIRIVSIRDRKGQPHVTIELDGPPLLHFEDGSTLSVMEKPRNGVGTVYETETPWVAVQIRGKQNSDPVEKYQEHVDFWLENSRITEQPRGSVNRTVKRGAKPITVFTAFSRSFKTLSNAIEFAEKQISQSQTGKKTQSFGSIYLQSGLNSLHRHLGDSGRIMKFMGDSIPLMLKHLDKLLSGGQRLDQAMKHSGIGVLMDSLTETGADLPEVTKKLMDIAMTLDDGKTRSVEQYFCKTSYGNGLKVVTHDMPLSPLMLLAGGYATGHEAAVVSHIMPSLKEVLDRIKREPEAVHLLRSSRGGISGQDLKSAFLFCGMADEYATLAYKVEVMVRAKSKELLREAMQLRAKGKIADGEFNFLRNTLSDAFENKIEAYAKNKIGGAYLLISPQPKKEVIIRPWMLEKDIKPVQMLMR